MFLQTNDYKVVCTPTDLDIISQSSEDIRQQAEQTAIEEVSGYVRSRYDIAKAYKAEGANRNPLLVQLTVSIALYYLGMWLPSFMGNDTREALYNNAVARLRDIQKGVISLQSENDTLETSAFSPDEYRTNKTIIDRLFGKQRLSEY